MHRNTCSTCTSYVEKVMDLRRKCLNCKPCLHIPSYSCFFLAGSMPWTVTEWSQPYSVCSVRSKRKRVSFYFTTSLCSPVCTSFEIWCAFPLSPIFWHSKKKTFISCKTVHVPNICLFYNCIVLIGICATNVNYFCALLDEFLWILCYTAKCLQFVRG